MEDDPGAAEDERTIELSSIAAIYPELTIDPKQPHCAQLDIAVTPAQPLKITFQSATDGVPPILPTPPTSIELDDGRGKGSEKPVHTQERPATVDEHELSHLPPLTLRISLPPEYPSESPPLITLSTSPAWLPRRIIRDLQRDCARLWEEMGRDSIVYTYIDHLQQAADDAFKVDREIPLRLPSDLKLALLDFDLKTKREIFENETFNCGICLEPKKGILCHQLLLCSHVFCIACLQDFYRSCIMEGDTDNVKCLDPNCGKVSTISVVNSEVPRKRRKQDRTLNPSELLQIPIEHDLVQRYVKLKRKKILESDKNTIYCPRQWCQGAARSKKHPKPLDPMNDIDELSSESEDDKPVPVGRTPKKDNPDDIPMSERLAVCEDCDFAFCSVCKKTWHGEFAKCDPRRKKELDEEEKASMTYLQSFTTPCPTCNAPSQKTMGCNHMICFRCRTHFCYLCASYLMPDNPYRHFNDVKSPCYMRLWELEGGDGDDVGRGYAGGNALAPWELDSDNDSDSDSDDGEIPDDADLDDNFFASDEEDETDDDEPAPDQRRPQRNMQVEIINFAREGAHNHRIVHNIPEQPLNNRPPPAAPIPPRRGQQQRNLRRGAQQANHQRRLEQEPHRAMNRDRQPPQHVGRPQPRAAPVAAPAFIGPEEEGQENIRVIPPLAAPGQGNNIAAALDRFLALAAADEEDEWDSDELDEVEFHEDERFGGNHNHAADDDVGPGARAERRQRHLGR